MMKTFIVLFISILFSLTSKAQVLTNATDSLSYSLGVLIGKNLQLGGYENLNLDLFMTALKASMKNENTLLSSTKCKEYIDLGASKIAMKQYESNRIAGEEFLTNNKKRTGVVALPNGLQYEVIKMGDGPKPKATDEVIVHYHGTLADGTVFDSSVERGESISFPLNGVIKGWTEILQLMPVGSKWKVYIPYQLAYGDRSAGPDIKPFSMLIFEIELLGIK
jgi:FKBP-type peptidyl-prolyl cis-trans isomerase FklB